MLTKKTEYCGTIDIIGVTFKYIGYEREWNPPAGFRNPDGRVFIVQDIRHNKVAHGHSVEEAEENLRAILAYHIFREILEQNGYAFR